MVSQSVNEQRTVIKFYTLLENRFLAFGKVNMLSMGTCLSNVAISKWMHHFNVDKDTTSDDKQSGILLHHNNVLS